MKQPSTLPVPLVLVAVRPLPLAEGELPALFPALLDEARALREGIAQRDIWWCATGPSDEAEQLHEALAAACAAAGLPLPQTRAFSQGSRNSAERLRELSEALSASLAGCIFLHQQEEDGRRALWLLGRGTDTRRARALADLTPLEVEGIVCTELTAAGQACRMGACRPDWREALLAAGQAPFAAETAVRETALRELGQRGVWLGSGQAEPLAVMCCGQGSVWPGMGRELYDQFPAARAAMDRLAAAADWDVLSLLDERDEEKIGLTRWQQPYLFLLEYAQWSHLASLGLRPALLCGHSLGELIALCLAGVYAPETAWYILDTRAQHMAELEARATRETGMMAVHAEAQHIEEARRLWPALYVSNYNTPKQYIVSGPRDMLMEARKHFRRQRLPAIMLNVSLAFHHPGMRVLRDMSLRRLNALSMQAPQIPLLSCVTTGFYPQQQREICEYIADLDENAVRWVECVRQMWTRDGIRHFVELGPQDTLCGLVADIEPRSLCLSASRKGHEAEGLRRTCARLYALGHIRADGLRAHAARWQSAAVAAAAAPVASSAAGTPPPGPLARRIIALLEETAGLPPGSVTPQWDLRYDLSLRSSRFPLLVQQLEALLGRSVSFEALMGVLTVGDLLAAVGLAAAPSAGAPVAEAHAAATGPADALDRRPFLRYAVDADGHWHPAAWDPVAHGPGLREGGAILAWSRDGQRAARLLEGLAALGQTLLVPRACEAACRPLERLGCLVRCPDVAADTAEAVSAADFLRAGLELLRREGVPLSGCLLEGLEHTAEEAQALAVLRECGDDGPLWCRRIRLLQAEELESFTAAALREAPESSAALGILEDDLSPLAREWGDMFAREVLLAGGSPVLWARAEQLGSLLPQGAQEVALRVQPWRERPEVFPGLFARQPPPATASGRDFLLSGEFSRYARPWLASCGSRPGADVPCLPASQALRSLLDGARLDFPWLAPNGLCDVRLGERPELPPGITRETRLDVRAQSWLVQDGVMTRMCRCRLDVRELTANGRHTDRWRTVMEGMALLGRMPAALPALWESGPAVAGDGLREVTDDGYAAFCARWHVGEASRLLAGRLPDGPSFRSGGDAEEPQPTLRFAVNKDGVAPEDVSGYTCLLRLVDAVEQGARLAQETLFAADAAAWRMTGIGFIRFAAPDARRAAVIELRCGWRTGQLIRFDAQVCDAGGTPLLTLNQMEFEQGLPAQTGDRA